MNEWEDITITRHDRERSHALRPDDVELSRQVFALSDLPQQRWLEVFIAAFVGSPGRLGRQAEIREQAMIVWGGPKIFDKHDANHLKKLVAYANEKYRELLQPVDLSGLDAVG